VAAQLEATRVALSSIYLVMLNKILTDEGQRQKNSVEVRFECMERAIYSVLEAGGVGSFVPLNV
jgi:hypothetical protein